MLQVRQALLHVVENSGEGVQLALKILTPAAKAAPDSVQVLLAMATTFVRGDQVPKARNLLKRIQVISPIFSHFLLLHCVHNTKSHACM
jgi:hypothetical protein